MNYSTIGLNVILPEVAFIVDIQALYEQLCQLSDQRKRRGVRYPLATLALIAVLAKFAGANTLQAIADWAKAHQPELVELLQLPRLATPHAITFSRVFGTKLDRAELESIIGAYFKRQLSTEVPQRGSLSMSIDGKTLRGTIPAGQTQGLHLMAAYLPEQGLVLAQVAVGSKTNEITAAPLLLKMVDLHGVVVTGDAMQAQKALSVQIVADGGDYLWLVKANQPGLLGEIEQLFEPLEWGKGFNAPALEFQEWLQYDQGHGRVEKRSITVSSELEGYSYWPHLSQVFKLEREWLEVSKDEVKHETRYGFTSLPHTLAGAARLMEITRGEWGIENSLHYVRDVTFGEDARQVRRGGAPQVLAALDNAVLGILRLGGVTNVAKTRRQWGWAFSRALSRLLP